MGNKTSQVIAASGFPPPSATVITLNNSVLEAGVYNRVLHSSNKPMILLLPTAPTDGMVVGVVVVGFVDTATDFEFDGNGKNIASANVVADAAGSSNLAAPVLFRFDADQDLWTVLTGYVTGSVDV